MIFLAEIQQKVYIYYVYIQKERRFLRYPMVILWLLYGYPMVNPLCWTVAVPLRRRKRPHRMRRQLTKWKKMREILQIFAYVKKK